MHPVVLRRLRYGEMQKMVLLCVMRVESGKYPVNVMRIPISTVDSHLKKNEIFMLAPPRLVLNYLLRHEARPR